MNLKKMSVIIKYAVPAVIVIVIFLFGNLIFMMARVTEVREQSAELVSLGNAVLHNSNKLVKLARIYAITQDEAALSEYESILNDYDSLDGKLETMAEAGLSDVEHERVTAIKELLGQMEETESRAIEAVRRGDNDLAASLVFGQEYENTDAMIALETESLIEAISVRTIAEAAKLTGDGRSGLIFIGVFFLLSLSMFIVFIEWFMKKSFWYESILDSIALPLSVTDMNRNWTFVNKPVEDFLGMKRADLIGKQCFNWGAGICNTPDCGINCLERGILSTAFNQSGMDFKVDTSYLTDRKNRKIGHIEAVQNITDIVSTNKLQADLVHGIRSSVGAVSQAAHQIAGMSEQVAENSIKNAESLSDTVMFNSKKGNEQMQEMLKIMDEINEAGENIEKILRLIDGIARQTNILALNASVESVRAGQHGASFSVVAEEVRNLAIKSTNAATNTGGFVVISMEKTAAGVEIAKMMSKSLADIVEGFNKSSEIVSDIARMNEEQLASINEINNSVKALEALVEQFDSRESQT